MKIIYILLVMCYCLMILMYLFRYQVSYRLVGTRPEVIEQRDLTHKEYNALREATNVRQRLSSAMLIFSTTLMVVSLLILYYKPFNSLRLVRAVLAVSFVLIILLLIGSGSKFVPTPPIR